MATKKISQLEAITETEDSDVLVIVDVSEGTTNKITKGNLLLGSGHSVELTLDPQTYQLVLKLKNAAGTELSTQSVDLPNENAVTGIEYENGILTITKQVGEPSPVDLSPLIEGLVTESDFNTFTQTLAETIQGINETIGAINVKNGQQDEAIEENYKEITKLKSKVAEQEEIINQLPQVSGEGESVTLNNTIKAPFTLFSPEGHSEQETTEGYQMLDTNETINKTTKNGVTYSLKDGVFSFNGTCTQSFDIFLNNTVSLSAGDYTMAAQNQSGSYTGTFGKYPCSSTNRVNIFDGGQVRGLFNRTVEENYDNVVLHFYVGSGSVFSNYKFSISLLQGTYTTSNIPEWEKYTNGASPNPSYEQPIKSAGENVNLAKYPYSETTKTTRDITFTDKGNGTIVASGTASGGTAYFNFYNNNSTDRLKLKKGVYTLSLENTPMLNTGVLGAIKDNSGDAIAGVPNILLDATRNLQTITVNQDFEISLYITINSGVSLNNFEFKIKIELGSTATPWSPYGMGSVNEKVSNRNWFDTSFRKNGAISGSNMTATEENGEYTMTATTSNPYMWYQVSSGSRYAQSSGPLIEFKEEQYSILITNNIFNNIIITTYDENLVSKGFIAKTTNQFTITKGTGTKYFSLRIGISNATAGQAYKTKVMVSPGSESLSLNNYVPHEEQTYSIYTQQPFRSIGDVRDVFFKNTKDSKYYDENLVENGWYERHEIGEEILDENTNIGSQDNIAYYNLIGRKSTTSILQVVLCNKLHFSCNANSATNAQANMENLSIGVNNNGTSKNIFIKNTDISTTERFKNWFGEIRPLIQFIRENPINLPCIQSQIDILENIPSTFSGQTNVFSIDEVKAYLRAKGLKDLNTLDSDINNVKQAIVALGGVV